MTQLPEHHRIDRKLQRIEARLRQHGAVLSCIKSLVEIQMADNAAALVEVAGLRQAIIDDQASDQAVVDGLDAALAAAVKNADTQPLIDAILEAKAQIKPVTSAS